VVNAAFFQYFWCGKSLGLLMMPPKTTAKFSFDLDPLQALNALKQLGEGFL
jgi:hypothetical protein